MVLQWIHFWQGNYDRVLTVKEEVLRTMAQRFHLRWYMWALSVTAWAYTALGRWQEAVADGQQASRVGEEFADPSTIAYAATTLAVLILPQVTWGGHAHMGSWQSRKLLGEGYWRVGESDEAIQTLAELLELAERCGAQFYLGAAHRLLGEIALTTNPMQVEAPLAAPHFEQSIAVLRAIKAENELALAYAGYGRLHRQQGNITLAREYLTQALEIFERLGTLGEPDKVRQALAELPRR